MEFLPSDTKYKLSDYPNFNYPGENKHGASNSLGPSSQCLEKRKSVQYFETIKKNCVN